MESLIDGMAGSTTTPNSVRNLKTLKEEKMKRISRGKLTTKKVSLEMKNLRVI